MLSSLESKQLVKNKSYFQLENFKKPSETLRLRAMFVSQTEFVVNSDTQRVLLTSDQTIRVIN